MLEHRVLLVDDEEDFVTYLAQRMKSRGVIVETANSGQEALEKAGNRNYDVVLLDLKMPGLDGIETLKRLKELDSELQIIILTGYGTVRTTVEALKLGAIDFLEKPADIREIMSIVRDAGSKKEQLAKERVADEIKDILGKKGW